MEHWIPTSGGSSRQMVLFFASSEDLLLRRETEERVEQGPRNKLFEELPYDSNYHEQVVSHQIMNTKLCIRSWIISVLPPTNCHCWSD